MELVHPLAEKYAAHYTSSNDDLLNQLLEHTEQHHIEKHMVSGKVQGQFLEMLSLIIKPKFILEIGTFTGYSALCLAKGLQENGELHTIEIREEDANLAKQYFDKSDYKNNIKVHIGNALNVIPLLNLEWDMVFIDGDKVNYSNYYDLILPKVRKGGIIIADNTLFHGQILEENIKGKNAKAIEAFNLKVKEDENVNQVLLTVRDGIMLILKN